MDLNQKHCLFPLQICEFAICGLGHQEVCGFGNLRINHNKFADLRTGTYQKFTKLRCVMNQRICEFTISTKIHCIYQDGTVTLSLSFSPVVACCYYNLLHGKLNKCFDFVGHITHDCDVDHRQVMSNLLRNYLYSMSCT